MLFNITSSLNRTKQLAINAVETGNSVLIFDVSTDSNVSLQIYGVHWGAATLAGADQTGFLFQYVAGYLDLPFNNQNPLFSRSNPDDNGELLFWIGSHLPTLQYDDFSNPIVIPPSRRLTIVCVQPLLAGAQAGSLVMGLGVRGDIKYIEPSQATIGGLVLR